MWRELKNPPRENKENMVKKSCKWRPEGARGWRMSCEGTGVSSNLLSQAKGNDLTYLLLPCYQHRWHSLKKTTYPMRWRQLELFHNVQ